MRAVEAQRVGGIAVQFDDVMRGNAGGLMKVVDILRHQAWDFAGAIEAGERAVTAPGPGLGETFLHDKAAAPGLVAHMAIGHECVERDRLVFGPQAAGRAEIGDAAFGRYPRPGERHDLLRALDQVSAGWKSHSQDRAQALL